MNPLFSRCVVIFLTPALLVDPAMAAGFASPLVQGGKERPRGREGLFQNQALAIQLLNVGTAGHPRPAVEQDQAAETLLGLRAAGPLVSDNRRSIASDKDYLPVTAADVAALDAFLNREALKIPEEYWDLLPFVPNPAMADLPEEASRTPFMVRFLKGYRIACRIHGAPEEDSPLNNQLARRQKRNNGAPYIIHILGMVWAAVRIGEIREGPVLIADTDHDVPEDGIENIQRQSPGISDQEAERLIREEILTTLGDDADAIFDLLRWFVRGDRTYREYIDAFKKAPLNVLLSKLFDQANNLYDIPYLMTHGKKDRAQRQVGKTLRYYSELISLKRHHLDPRYRRTVIYLMKTLIRASDHVDWLEPYYEREKGSRKPSEDPDRVNPEILDALGRFQQWLTLPWVNDAMREEQGLWSPSIEISTINRFSERIDSLQKRIRRGVALPAQYTDPDDWKALGLEYYPDVLTVDYDAQEYMGGLEQVKAFIEAAASAAGGLRTGEYVVDVVKNSEQGYVSLKTAMHRPLGQSADVVQARLWPLLGKTIALRDLSLSSPGEIKDEAGDDSIGFHARLMKPEDIQGLMVLFEMLPRPGRSAGRTKRFFALLRRMLSNKSRGFGLVWDTGIPGYGAEIQAAVLALLGPSDTLDNLRIIDVVVESEAMGTGIGEEFLRLSVECAGRIPSVRKITVEPLDELLGAVLEDLGFQFHVHGPASGRWVLKIRRSA